MHHSIKSKIDSAYSVGYLSESDILSLPECEHITLEGCRCPDKMDIEADRAARLSDDVRFNRSHTVLLISDDVRLSLVKKEV